MHVNKSETQRWGAIKYEDVILVRLIINWYVCSTHNRSNCTTINHALETCPCNIKTNQDSDLPSSFCYPDQIKSLRKLPQKESGRVLRYAFVQKLTRTQKCIKAHMRYYNCRSSCAQFSIKRYCILGNVKPHHQLLTLQYSKEAFFIYMVY